MSRRVKKSAAVSTPKPAALRSAASPPGSNWRAAVWVGVLLCIVAGTFIPALRNDFVDWDDRASVQFNPDFTPPRLDSLGHYWTGAHLQFYVPMTYTVLWIVAHAAGSTNAAGAFVLAPTAFHAFNLLTHLANTALAFIVLRRLVRDQRAAWMGAAFFALHPIQAEAVSWVSSMYSSLSALFALIAMWQYLRFSDLYFGPPDGNAKIETLSAGQRTHAWIAFGIACVCFGLGLLTKPTIVLLPVVLGILEVGVRGRNGWRVARPLGLIMLCLAVPIAIITSVTQSAPAVYSPLWLRPFVAADTLSFYLYKTILPIHLIPDYGRSPRWLEQQRPWLYLTTVTPILLTVIGLAVWRKSRWPAVVVAVWVVALFPMLGLKAFDYQRFSTVADRYAYFAMFAPALFVAWIVARIGGRVVVGVMSCVLIGFAVLTSVQTTHWRDSKTLFDHTLAYNPRSLAAQSVFAFFASREGRNDDAIRGYEAALQQNPGDPVLLFNIGNIHLRSQRWPDAIRSYAQSIESSGGTSEVFANLAIALAQSGRPDDALRAVGQALEMDPRNADAQLNAAIISGGLGKFDEARQHYEAVIRLGGNVAAAKRGLAALNSM